jgi:sortase A
MVHVLNRTVTYEVDQIHIVLPEEMEDLAIDPEKDYCTLLTCTPYGINSHRLLVRGHRVKNINGDAKVVADALQIQPVHVAPFIMIFIIAGLLVKFMVIPGKRSF